MRKTNKTIKIRRGFTLIELLVVIAIIALLMAILTPALKKAKQMGEAVVCVKNQGQVAVGWYSYATDNDDKLVDGNVPNVGTDVAPADVREDTHWVNPPHDIDSNGDPDYTVNTSGNPITLEQELNGIRSGMIWPYLSDVAVFHCPGDRLSKRVNAPYHRSYSIAAYLNGEGNALYKAGDAMMQFYKNEHNVTRLSHIRMASEKIAIIEDLDNRGRLMGSFYMQPSDAYEHVWGDAVAVWHGKSSVMAYADGHAERHKWQDQLTLDVANNTITAALSGWGSAPDPKCWTGNGQQTGELQDLFWLRNHYFPRRNVGVQR